VALAYATRRPKRLARNPIGKVPAHMPHTIRLIGSVARLLSGANIAPTMLPVVTITVLFAPASAWPIASTSALRRARRSPAAASKGVSATADIFFSGGGFAQDGGAVLARLGEWRYCADRRPEMLRNGCSRAG
jgi:hypothetical protein